MGGLIYLPWTPRLVVDMLAVLAGSHRRRRSPVQAIGVAAAAVGSRAERSAATITISGKAKDIHMTYGERSVRTGAAQETVAILGAGGTMGFAMARNIARAGIAVRAWNRSPDKAEPLAADGAYLADTPADAAAGAGIVLTMLADADAVGSAMEGDGGALPVMAGSGQPDPPIWLQMSTVGEEATEWCIDLAVRYGVVFVDSPLFELIAYRLVEGTGEHGDKDVSATYLTGAPEQAV